MSENQRPNEVSVDRREETAVTQQPGYAATEQVTRDVVAEGWPPPGALVAHSRKCSEERRTDECHSTKNPA